MIRLFTISFGAVVLATLGGCGQRPVYPVQGKVMFDGKPMIGGGSISFVPLGDDDTRTAGGEIAADGSYSVGTYKPGDGAMASAFRIVIHQVTEQEPQQTEDGKAVARAGSSVPVEQRIPLLYGDNQKSPLKATVEARAMNELNFDLKRD